MGRASTKQNKSIYQLRREEAGLTREQASEVMTTLSPDRIEKIENGKCKVYPEDVIELAEGYRRPDLCNYYCARECEIGKSTVPELKLTDLSQIILEMLASLNSMHRKQERLIEITADGVIQDEEIKDFVEIQKELEKISITVDTLQLWSKQMLAEKKINMELYNAMMKGEE